MTLRQRRNFVTDPHGVSQTHHQEKEREMAALFASQVLLQGPIQNDKFFSGSVVKQVAGMRVAVKHRILRSG